jgi:hypothetical protein
VENDIEHSSDLMDPVVDDSKRLTAKDYVTLGIATLALIVSAASFYFTNLRVDDNLTARIIDYSGHESGPSVQIALVNAGNRAAIVLDAHYSIRSVPDGPSILGRKAIMRETDTFPLVLPPHEMRIVTVGFQEQDAIRSHSQGAVSPNRTPADPDTRRLYCEWEIVSIDSSGQMHLAHLAPKLELSVSQTQLRSVTLGDNRPLINLFAPTKYPAVEDLIVDDIIVQERHEPLKSRP